MKVSNNILKVLFVDSTHQILPEKLSDAGFLCDYKPDITEKEIANIISGYDGLIIRSKLKIDKTIIDKASRMKFIGRVGAGLENIDTEYAHQKGIKCFNSPEGNRDAVGEHALGMLLCLLHKITIADREVREGAWIREQNRGTELKGKTVGIIGYGNMGSAFAQRLMGFDARVIAYDKYKSGYSDNYVTEKTLGDLFRETDILSIHVPLTDETHFMIDDSFISRFKKNIYIINTARGKVLKTDDLVINLRSGKVTGAALDVLEYEQTSFEQLHSAEKLPEAFEYLIQSERVILTPHIAGWTHESNIKLSEYIADKIIRAFS
ncbi:MAG: NAD(P)-dependent oxidoreductase [Bacteroidales bacterium]|jgi:D-3-phosphoglycerate dehydrogenase|nr:NAD(P)-dependent oxidoreductase [Bacteroidales bacterium]